MRKYVLICNNRRKKILYYYDFRDECVYGIDGGETSKNAEKGARKGGYYGGIIGIFLYPVLGKASYHLPSGMLACISVLMGLATLLDVSEGDDIYLEVSSLNYKPVKVMHIAENYYYHYVYMTPECYQSLFGKDIEYDEIFVVNKDPEDISYENDFSAKYLDNNAVSGITFTRTISDRIESMITSMNIVTYVLVVSAGLLAFIVLYNLNNINISERQRELATLKVLGFYDGEISMYVFRENIMLTVLGTIFGIFFGIWLHRFVILTAELDIMMFGRQIYTKSYIYSILLTIGFSIIVNIVMHWKMKKIDMIESLKSVE